MLQSLKIDNYALIKHCEVDFEQGFSVITGETGAGKTILLGALALVLGQRADVNSLMDKDKKCIIEANFLLNETSELKSIFMDNDLDFDKETILRREILPSGKSRAFVNDTPVQLTTVKDLAKHLVDIHSQSSTIRLKDKGYQRQILDNMIEDKSLIDTYKEKFTLYKSLEKEILELKSKQAEFLREQSYNEFLFEELDKVKLSEGEQEQLETQVELLSNAMDINQNISSSLYVIDNNDNSLVSQLTQVKSNLAHISGISAELDTLLQRVDSCLIELKDIYTELASVNDSIVFDEQKLNDFSDRLNTIYSLEKKHNVTSVGELLQIYSSLDKKLQLSSNLSNIIEDKENDKKQILSELEELANQLHQERELSASYIEKEVKPLLGAMAMQHAVLQVEVVKQEDISEHGADDIRFLFSANKTKDNTLNDIDKVISGGELSRLMLALKAVMAQRYDLPTLVFDEIDTGISGDIASKVADIMSQIAERHQVLVITHLVQMASKAKQHYKVAKHIEDDQTVSNITTLTQDQRVNELAAMLSFGDITPEALANAKSLLRVR